MGDAFCGLQEGPHQIRPKKIDLHSLFASCREAMEVDDKNHFCVCAGGNGSLPRRGKQGHFRSSRNTGTGSRRAMAGVFGQRRDVLLEKWCIIYTALPLEPVWDVAVSFPAIP
ncbi:hypothetical protein IAQ61_004633 [Plenodomus lingam]|uniref:uncharacterized protein n=1 Tax=Leptosphaeria maculans TaxID=5022 RepID=UPI0033179AC3|nr:hypothetical protein IAQ61_004633 [Plenodomus lingam]